MDSLIRGTEPQPDPEREEDPRKAELAIRQLERAELYVVSAVNLDLERWEHRQALHRARCEVLAAIDLLRQPRPLR